MQEVVHQNDQFNSTDLFDAFKIQLAKDFGQSNFDAAFIMDLEPDYVRIHDKIVQQLQRSEKRADAHVMQLLNRIDISETQMKNHLHKHVNENRLATIANLIIKRVLQKIVIKQYYKRNEGG